MNLSTVGKVIGDRLVGIPAAQSARTVTPHHYVDHHHAEHGVDRESMGVRLSDVTSDGLSVRPVGAIGGDLFRAAARPETPEQDRPAVDDSQAAMERLRMPFEVDGNGPVAD